MRLFVAYYESQEKKAILSIGYVDCALNYREFGVRVLVGARDFSLLQNVWAESRDHSVRAVSARVKTDRS